MSVAVLAACRTPIVPADGVFAQWHPVDLAAVLMAALAGRAAIEPHAIDEVWIGCAEPVGAQGADMARAAVLAAGWPEAIGGTVLDRGETSGSAAVHAAATAIEAGMIEHAVVLGVSSASIVRPGASALGRTYGRPWGDAPAARYDDRGGLLPPPRVAERHVARLDIGREIQDEVTMKSHELRRAAAPSGGLVEIGARPGESATVQRNTPIADDVLRPVPDDPAALPPSFADDGTITGASFAPPADGVAGVLLGRDRPDSMPMGRLRGMARGAGSPFDATGGVGPTIEAALARAGVAPDEVSRWEVVEPSAAAFLAFAAAIGDPGARINPDGGALCTGDAAAAEEVRLAVDALHRAEPGEIVVTLAGGPTGSAVSVWERPS